MFFSTAPLYSCCVSLLRFSPAFLLSLFLNVPLGALAEPLPQHYSVEEICVSPRWNSAAAALNDQNVVVVN